MYPSVLVLAATLAMTTGSDSRVAEVGDYVVIFAEISGCPSFPGIIAAPEVGEDGAILLPRIDPIRVAGRDESQVEEQISRAIAAKRPTRDVPSSLKVDVISKHQFADLRDLYIASLHYLASERCDKEESGEWRNWPEQWERLKQIERSRTAALPPNRARLSLRWGV